MQMYKIIIKMKQIFPKKNVSLQKICRMSAI